MMHVRRFKRRRKIVVTITWPEHLLQNMVTASLLLASLIGLVYTLGPSLLHGSPASSVVVKAQAPSPPKHPALAKSLPVSLEAPDIGLSTDLITLGKNDDGTLAVPDRYDIAGWYQFSPTPGEIGPSIIVGHVDNYLGAAIFFYL